MGRPAVCGALTSRISTPRRHAWAPPATVAPLGRTAHKGATARLVAANPRTRAAVSHAAGTLGSLPAAVEVRHALQRPRRGAGTDRGGDRTKPTRVDGIPQSRH